MIACHWHAASSRHAAVFAAFVLPMLLYLLYFQCAHNAVSARHAVNFCRACCCTYCLSTVHNNVNARHAPSAASSPHKTAVAAIVLAMPVLARLLYLLYFQCAHNAVSACHAVNFRRACCCTCCPSTARMPPILAMLMPACYTAASAAACLLYCRLRCCTYRL